MKAPLQMRSTALLRSRLARAILVLPLCFGTSAQSGKGSLGWAARAKCSSHGYEAEIQAAVRDVAAVWPLPASIIKAVILRESGFKRSALSSAGAVGLMQVLPSNAKALGFPPDALWNPSSNILAGARLLAVLLRHYQGDAISALVAYNARPRRRLAPLPDNRETPSYVRSVLLAWATFERCSAEGLSNKT